MPDAFDLQQIGKLFDDAIAAIRNGTPDMDALKPQAVGWLKGARYQLIRDVEEAYYELEQACDKPLLLPPWVVEPVKKLRLFTEDVPAVLEPFKSAMGGNLNNLLKDCGFQSRYGTYSGGIWLEIHFPTQHTAQNAKAPRSLHVEDEFSSQTATGVNPFTRLIAKAQASASGDADSSRNIRFRSALEEEKDFKKIFRACSFSNTATPVPSIVPPGRRSTSGVAGFFADGLQQAETKVDFPLQTPSLHHRRSSSRRKSNGRVVLPILPFKQGRKRSDSLPTPLLQQRSLSESRRKSSTQATW
ncbi:hypothetical protein MSAN_00083700 [Mycena sanguinolenta]|uniref:Uncharacterized protein n=1 Tax=Mycena sanguinolenta TaxID=230812 RepID=A0A8H6ZCT1_9AGAR|nr:hypothetical protein MSAN_00083700 [Mycena sanguinolenta]